MSSRTGSKYCQSSGLHFRLPAQFAHIRNQGSIVTFGNDAVPCRHFRSRLKFRSVSNKCFELRVSRVVLGRTPQIADAGPIVAVARIAAVTVIELLALARAHFRSLTRWT